jgi:D-sedoheptulose 7-phosphate isomerase
MAQSAHPNDVGVLFDRRVAPLEGFLDQAGTIADTCRELAARFAAGGTLYVFGNGGPSTDAQHVAVEFVHPVIVGKRALPAVSLTGDIATLTGIANDRGLAEVFTYQLRILATAGDIALGISTDGNCANVAAGLRTARSLGMLTVALVGADGGAILSESLADQVICVRSQDPQVVKEVHVTAYHLLWELVHIFLERSGSAAVRLTVAAGPGEVRR